MTVQSVPSESMPVCAALLRDIKTARSQITAAFSTASYIGIMSWRNRQPDQQVYSDLSTYVSKSGHESAKDRLPLTWKRFPRSLANFEVELLSTANSPGSREMVERCREEISQFQDFLVPYSAAHWNENALYWLASQSGLDLLERFTSPTSNLFLTMQGYRKDCEDLLKAILAHEIRLERQEMKRDEWKKEMMKMMEEEMSATRDSVQTLNSRMEEMTLEIAGLKSQQLGSGSGISGGGSTNEVTTKVGRSGLDYASTGGFS